MNVIFIITSNNKPSQSLNWTHLVFPCTGVDTMVDWWRFTQDGSEVRRSCQSTIVGGACTELRHSDRNLRTAWFEKGDSEIGIKKIMVSGWRLYLRGPGVIRGSGGSCNKKYILINWGWVEGGWDKSLVKQIFSKIWTFYINFFIRQTDADFIFVCSPVREVAVTDTVAFQMKFEWSKESVGYNLAKEKLLFFN